MLVADYRYQLKFAEDKGSPGSFSTWSKARRAGRAACSRARSALITACTDTLPGLSPGDADGDDDRCADGNSPKGTLRSPPLRAYHRYEPIFESRGSHERPQKSRVESFFF